MLPYNTMSMISKEKSETLKRKRKTHEDDEDSFLKICVKLAHVLFEVLYSGIARCRNLALNYCLCCIKNISCD